MTKMTYVAALELAIAAIANLADNATNAEAAEKLTALKAQLEKKATAERKPTATQTANEGFKTAILAGMESGVAYTITDLLKGIPELAELSNQRVSAIVRQLKDEGLLTREEVKRKAYFTKVERA